MTTPEHAVLPNGSYALSTTEVLTQAACDRVRFAYLDALLDGRPAQSAFRDACEAFAVEVDRARRARIRRSVTLVLLYVLTVVTSVTVVLA